jgi:hypothetical protein
VRNGVARAIGWLLLIVGASVFAIRFQHEGPYALPRGGNLAGGVLALGLGTFLARPWLGRSRWAAPLQWLGVAASPVVLFFALYATLAEWEEVVVLHATNQAGEPSPLRLWIVDRGDAAWVTMPRGKAEAHGLDGARVELLRRGERRCVVATRFDDRETVNAVHHHRHEKYAVQRLATAIGLFGRDAGEDAVAVRLEPCPDA